MTRTKAGAARIIGIGISLLLAAAPATSATSEEMPCETILSQLPRVDEVQRLPSLVCERTVPAGTHSLSLYWSDSINKTSPLAVGHVQLVVASEDLSVFGFAICDVHTWAAVDCRTQGHNFALWGSSPGPYNWGFGIRFTSVEPVRIFFSVGETRVTQQVATHAANGYFSLSIDGRVPR
ncbi:MAG TPA: hypothetical protein VGB64_04885 [Actinomycetota bacterium]